MSWLEKGGIEMVETNELLSVIGYWIRANIKKGVLKA